MKDQTGDLKYFKSKRLSIGHKVRVYRTYIEPLRYNSETWTLTSKLTDAIDSFHRRLLRIAINIKYPRIIKNEKLYALTQEIPLSQKIRKRRLTLLGHILRLDPETPAQKALKYFMTPHPKPVGGQKKTWIGLITKDLKKTLKDEKIKTPLKMKGIESLTRMAEDRAKLSNVVKRETSYNILLK